MLNVTQLPQSTSDLEARRGHSIVSKREESKVPAERSAEPPPLKACVDVHVGANQYYPLHCTSLQNHSTYKDFAAARLTLRRGVWPKALSCLQKRCPSGAARGQSMEPEKPLHALPGRPGGLPLIPHPATVEVRK